MSMTKHKETLFWFNAQKYLLLLGLFIVVSLPLFKISTVLFSLNSDWSHGFAHPLQGWDHILTMIAVGIWAAQLRGQAIWLLPATFVSVMSFGGLVGVASLVIPSVEVMILLSGLVFSAFIVRKVKFTTQLNVFIVAFFAFFNGYAHGQEISASASLLSYTLGFVFATLLLHCAGIATLRLVALLVAIFLGSNVNAEETDVTDKKATEVTTKAKAKKKQK